MKRLFVILLLLIPAFIWGQRTLDILQNWHQVKKGETIQSIAESYGITPEQLKQANPDIKIRRKGKIKKGTLITIPKPVVEEKEPAEEEIVHIQTVIKSYSTVRLAVLLPLEEKSDRGAKFVEFYQGLLMAADSVKQQGINVDIYAFHTGSSTQEIQALLRSNDLSQMNVIVGPADQAQIPPLCTYCTEHNIRLVLPFSAPSTNTIGHPLLYLATPASSLTQQGATMLVSKKFEDNNFIILETEQADERGGNMIEALRQELSRKGISLRTMPIDGDDFAIESSLNQFKMNCIVPNNTSIKTLNVFFAKLHDFQKNHIQYKISMLGYPEWQTYTGTLLKDFYTYDTYIYSSYYRNPLQGRTSVFDRDFMNNFKRPMIVSYPRYGMMGFDLGYYFMNGLARLGDTFEEHQNELQYFPFQHMFNFQRNGEGNGFLNHAVLLIHYKPEQEIEMIVQ
ncbi:MAG: LysM peptidoglycan-binding domain-containing protein [Bacteroidaceae bacterium]|nr:LysM peptidoglycan-binding domain-containing protein [Bacteroidaceae bacterium]